MEINLYATEFLVGVQKSVRQNIVSSTDYRQKLITLKNNISYQDCQLPNTFKIPRTLKKRFSQVVLDEAMTEDLENIGAINWTRSELGLLLQAGAVPRDGNCLAHSISLAVWGVRDDGNILRELLHKAVLSDIEAGHFKRRWSRHYLHELSKFTKCSPQIIDREWEDIVNNIINYTSRGLCAAVPHQSLEAVHIYILANILRRPIIVIAGRFACSVNGQRLQDNSIAGVYLPLEWMPVQCCKNPIILGYHLNHFCPLLSEVSCENIKDFLFPLVDKDLCFLPIRFLLEVEDHKAWELIQSYMVIKELELNCPLSTTTKIPWVQMNFNPPSIKVFDIVLKMCEQEQGGDKDTHKIAAGTNTSVIIGAAYDPLVHSVVPSAPLMSGFENEQHMSLMNERCKNNCGYHCSVATYPFCHQCFLSEWEKIPQKATAPDIYMSSITEGMFPESNSNSFEVISFPSSKHENYKISMNESEKIYVIKTQDIHTTPSDHRQLEDLVSGILNVSSLREQQPFSKESPLLGSKVRDLQKEKEEKLMGQSQRPASDKVLPSSANFSPSHKTFQSRGSPCVIKGCYNFGDPAEDNMCSSCYRKRLNPPPPNSHKEYVEVVQSSSRQNIPQSSNFINAPLLWGSAGNRTPKLHMQESGSGFSEAVPQGVKDQYKPGYPSLYNEEQQTRPHELVTNISSTASRPFLPVTWQENIPKTFNEVYERTLFKKSNESKCQRSPCNNYGNANKQGYCNACFEQFKKEILAAEYGDDVPDKGL